MSSNTTRTDSSLLSFQKTKKMSSVATSATTIFPTTMSQQDMHSDVSWHFCSNCDQIFQSETDLGVHFITMHGHLRQECSADFLTPDNLNIHRKLVHQNFQALVHCFFCASTIRSMPELNVHTEPSHVVELYSPPLSPNRSIHPATRPPGPGSTCTDSNVSSQVSGHLKEYIRLKHGQTGTLPCNSCDNLCTGSEKILEHLQAYHSINDLSRTYH